MKKWTLPMAVVLVAVIALLVYLVDAHQRRESLFASQPSANSDGIGGPEQPSYPTSLPQQNQPALGAAGGIALPNSDSDFTLRRDVGNIANLRGWGSFQVSSVQQGNPSAYNPSQPADELWCALITSPGMSDQDRNVVGMGYWVVMRKGMYWWTEYGLGQTGFRQINCSIG